MEILNTQKGTKQNDPLPSVTHLDSPINNIFLIMFHLFPFYLHTQHTHMYTYTQSQPHIASQIKTSYHSVHRYAVMTDENIFSTTYYTTIASNRSNNKIFSISEYSVIRWYMKEMKKQIISYLGEELDRQRAGGPKPLQEDLPGMFKE